MEIYKNTHNIGISEIQPLLELAKSYVATEGEVDFLGLKIQISKGVMDPTITKTTGILAQETEKLVTLETQSILELGTGSGAIALYLANKFPNVKIDSCDILLEAVNCCKLNIAQLKLQNLSCYQSDVYNSLPIDLTYDLICCSPPASQTKEFDPLNTDNYRSLAFGFDFQGQMIRQIFDGLETKLNPRGKLILYCNSNSDFKLLSQLADENNLFETQRVIEKAKSKNHPFDSFIQIYTFKQYD